LTNLSAPGSTHSPIWTRAVKSRPKISNFRLVSPASFTLARALRPRRPDVATERQDVTLATALRANSERYQLEVAQAPTGKSS
jgi:hypothetical protein